MILGKAPLGAIPVGAQVDPTWTVPAPVVIPPGRDEVYLVDLAPYDPATAATREIRFSTHGYTTEPSDTPPNRSWPQAAEIAVSLEQKLGLIDFGRRGEITAGDLVLLLHDGDRDELLDLYWDQRPVTVKRGLDGWRYADFETIFQGYSQSIAATTARLTIKLRDLAALLREPFQAATYGGTGGDDGGAELKGVVKPWCGGFVRNVQPIAVDTVNHRRQFHNGPINDVPALYDAGSPLTKVAGTPSAGQYQVETATGFVQLAGEPSGILTGDVEGDATGSYVSSVTAVLDRILRVGIGFGDSDLASISVGDATAGIYVTDPLRREEVLDQYIAGLGAWWAINRQSKFMARLIEAPSSPVATYTADEIRSIACIAAPPPVRKVTVGYRRTWRVMTEAELALAVTSSERARLTAESAKAVWESPSILALHPLAREIALPAILDGAAAADDLATRLGAFYGSRRPKVWQVVVRGTRHRREVGETVRIVLSRFGFDAGRDLIVDGYQESARTGDTVLTLVG